ncbi:zinc finger and BTB domain-containing protein 24 isoform X2 [Lucilia sericata]|uniref:zinc finger and BTB domain-containing protein 24 isoform X2 n=1 Tax=Lucilia sericata TaxID=13632 RepID=UPI0018A8050F|nr:zinc finger and BTB domain-containing protein 24 isoform X2 [Lucilia sericata]
MIKCPQQMITPTLHQPLHSKVTNYLNDQRRQGQFCDLILELESGDSIYGHFCVVAAQSRFIGGSHFQQKTLQFSIHNPLKVTIKNFQCTECLQTIGDFFYEDMVTIIKEHETHFKQLAKILVVGELMKIFQIPEESNEIIEITKGECSGIAEDLIKVEEEQDVKQVEGVINGETTFSKNQNIFDEKKTYFKLKNPRSSSSNSKINYCLACDFKCYRVHEMITHMRNCEASHLTCSLCEVGFLSWREYDFHLRRHDADVKKPFFCLECGIRFMTKAALTLHHPKHSKETPHLCPHCGKGFKWKQGLSTHLQVHNAEKRMLCDVCGYSTTHMKALKSHKLRHAAEFFKCPHPGCHHQANRKENLKLHIETHKQERPFVCEICGCKFSLSKNLKRHAMKHSSDNISKFKCQLCSFSSHRSDKLKEHVQRVHTEKAMQLELPEIVENAFESKTDLDEFTLPSLPSDMDSQKSDEDLKMATKEKDKKKVRKRCVRKTVMERKLKPIVPKGIHNHRLKSV